MKISPIDHVDITVPPVIVIGQPDDVLSTLIQLIATQLACSSDVHVA